MRVKRVKIQCVNAFCNLDKKRAVNYLMMSQRYFATPWVASTQTNPILMSFIQMTSRLDVAQ